MFPIVTDEGRSRMAYGHPSDEMHQAGRERYQKLATYSCAGPRYLMRIRNLDGAVILEIEDPEFGESLNLAGADLRRAALSGADLMDANLRGANLAEADLYWALLHGADLSEANLSAADLRGNLTGAKLVNANLFGANLGADNLGGATSLQGADFTGAELRQARVEGAEFDGQTKFPKGFYPLSYGMVKK